MLVCAHMHQTDTASLCNVQCTTYITSDNKRNSYANKFYLLNAPNEENVSIVSKRAVVVVIIMFIYEFMHGIVPHLSCSCLARSLALSLSISAQTNTSNERPSALGVAFNARTPLSATPATTVAAAAVSTYLSMGPKCHRCYYLLLLIHSEFYLF